MADDAGRLNEVLAETSFLYGGNAGFVEDLHARWAEDPNSVEPSWRAFFDVAPRQGERGGRSRRPAVVDPRTDRRATARLAVGDRRPVAGGGRQAGSPDQRGGACRHRRRGPRPHAGFAARDHDDPRLPHARPPGGQPRPAGPGGDAGRRHRARPGPLRLRRERLRPADLPRLSCWAWRPRPCARSWRSCGAPTAATSACSTCTSPTRPRRPGCSSASRAATRRSPSPAEGKIAILKKLIETEGFERFLHKRFPGTKRFGLDGGESMVPALEQIIKRGGALGVQRHRHRHAPPRPPERAGGGDGQALPGDLPRVPGRLVAALGRRGLRRREVPPGRLVGPHLRRQQRPPVADRQPQPPGDRQPGGARQGARQAGLPRCARTPPPAAATCCRC